MIQDHVVVAFTLRSIILTEVYWAFYSKEYRVQIQNNSQIHLAKCSKTNSIPLKAQESSAEDGYTAGFFPQSENLQLHFIFLH